MTCPSCNKELQVGEWPFCPHGFSRNLAHGIQTDEGFIGGQLIENLDHEPVMVYSRAQLKAEAERRGLYQRDQWAGPHDKYLTNWGATIDPQTLENARVLVSRPGALKSHDSPARLRVETFVRDPED